MRQHYDVIVLGVGGVGSAALYHLAVRGLRVLGLEQFSIGHNRGSSHGETRAIRKAYFEHPSYVPLLERAYANWRELERQSQSTESLLVEQGILEIGPADGMLVQGVLQASRQHQLALEQVSEGEFAERFPGFVLPADSVALYEPAGGYLHVERCVQTYAELAVQHGAQLVTGQPVTSWQLHSQGVLISTGEMEYSADRLVVTAGAWASELLRDLEVPLQVLRKHLHWYQVDPGAYAQSSGSPVFFYERPQGCYYGFPSLPGDVGTAPKATSKSFSSKPPAAISAQPACIKVAEHTGGEVLHDPAQVSDALEPEEVGRVERFLSECLPDVKLRSLAHAVCMYTMSPDGHFIIDRHPLSEAVVFAAGLSGHGFKFASVLGEVLADLATTGQTALPIDFLGLARFQK
ncbi:MAG: N-methyl-L-tryptophan oxidase [bacterium]|nr:N-methyl-L-tryptophan oxidase [bacterium]